jgi:phosphatidylinositol glycan class K
LKGSSFFLFFSGGGGTLEVLDHERLALREDKMKMRPRQLLVLSLLQLVSLGTAPSGAAPHASNYAVIVDTSQYWFNYRHAANAFSIYQLLKEPGGYTDDHVVLMIADEYEADARNPAKNGIYAAGISQPSLWNADTEIDYRGEDVTAEAFLHVLTAKRSDRNQQPVLESDENSHVLIYLTGHGGDQFLKFRDEHEVMSSQLAGALRAMHAAGKYREVLLIADTCQAFTLGDAIVAQRVPNVTVIGSSLKGESSYAHHADPDLGLSVIEKYTHALTEHVKRRSPSVYRQSLQKVLVDPYSYQQQRAHIGATDVASVRKLTEVPFSDFFMQAALPKEEKAAHLLPQPPPSLFSGRRASSSADDAPSPRNLETALRQGGEQQYASAVDSSQRRSESRNVTALVSVHRQPWEPDSVNFGVCVLVLLATVVGAHRVGW